MCVKILLGPEPRSSEINPYLDGQKWPREIPPREDFQQCQDSERAYCRKSSLRRWPEEPKRNAEGKGGVVLPHPWDGDQTNIYIGVLEYGKVFEIVGNPVKKSQL